MLFDSNGNTVRHDGEKISTEAMSYINEMILSEGLSNEELVSFLESQREVTSAIAEDILMEKTIVRLDKKAKLSKARKMAIFTVAKEKNDKDFKKLMKLWKMERFLEAKLDKKYGNEGARRAKKAVAKSSKAKSGMIRQAAANVSKQLNGDKVRK